MARFLHRWGRDNGAYAYGDFAPGG
jgi:hypothetical protein